MSAVDSTRAELAVIAGRAQDAISRIMPVIGDSCEPKFPSGSFVIVAPATRYEAPDYYVIHDGLGPIIVFAEFVRREVPTIRFGNINPRYSRYERPIAEFERHLLGRVVAHLTVFDKELLS